LLGWAVGWAVESSGIEIDEPRNGLVGHLLDRCGPGKSGRVQAQQDQAVQRGPDLCAWGARSRSWS
jgi:hypothetical protein